jgi:nucleoid-associated protein YgaU
MNRQVGPSILLSVMIVCFFAVALYQRDPPRSPGGGSRSASADAIGRSDSLRPRGPIRSTPGQPETVELVHTASARRDIKPQPTGMTSAASLTNSTRLPARSAPTPGLRSNGSGGEREGVREEVLRQPGSAFTVVEADETLEDVARRVYGSGTHVDSLWRANRDALSGKDAPLTEGMVLRTPVIR